MIAETARQFFVNHAIPPCRLVAAVSGGVDSTALLLALAELREDGFELACAHVNHHLRGTDSDADEQFVRDLCDRLAIPLHVADGTLDAEAIRDRGIEAAAREVRYARLAAIREETGSRYVATAHQQNDQAETVLMRLLTGSGIAGLRGIHPIRDDGFVRPLLDVTREQIEAYLAGRGVTPRLDHSNDDPRFLRNRVRAFLRELGGKTNLAHVADQARRLWPLIEVTLDAAEREYATVLEDETRFSKRPDPLLLQRHIRRLDPRARDFDAGRLANEWESIRRVTVTKQLELIRRGEAVILRRVAEGAAAFSVALGLDAPAYIAELRLTVHVARCHENQKAEGRRQRAEERSGARSEARSGAPASTAVPGSALCLLPSAFCLHQPFQLPPAATPQFLVRGRRPGDRFQPLGLSSPKKLKDFLIDRKIAVEVRDRLPLLIWNDEIVWVAGVEVSERFKVTSPPGDAVYEVWLEGRSDGDDAADDSRDPDGLQR